MSNKFKCKNCGHEHHTLHKTGVCDTHDCMCNDYKSERIL